MLICDIPFGDPFQYKFNQPIGGWNTTNVVYMVGMFFKAEAFNQDLPWDVVKVRNMTQMFYGAKNFHGSIKDWNPLSVKDMSFMFANTNFNGDITEWKTYNLKTANSMFYASSFNRDISGWPVGNLEDIGMMFAWATSFNQNMCTWADYDGLKATNANHFQVFDHTGCPSKGFHGDVDFRNPQVPSMCHPCDTDGLV